MDILRFITAGSVDDGKSTLIGRLLYDSKNILTDQLEAIEKASKNGNGTVDLALLTDGLRAEREQGITIDVAYRYFSTPKRKFIVADAPGHVQYTRNMITGASNVDLAIILIDARHGVAEQTRRHSIIASLLRIPHIVVAVNKIDLTGYSENVFSDIVIEYSKMASQLGLQNVTYIPVSALNGENITERSFATPWYQGKPLLEYLEEVAISDKADLDHARFQVQYVIRPQIAALPDYRGYAGRVGSGVYKKGDKVTVLPAGTKSTISAIETNGREKGEAFAGQSVVLHLTDDIDISRGDVIVKEDDRPEVNNELEVLLCWMDKKTLKKGNRYLVQHNSKVVKAVVKDIRYRLNVNTLEKEYAITEVSLNDIVSVELKLAEGLAYDRYSESRSNGSIILIDETSNVTAGGGIIQ